MDADSALWLEQRLGPLHARQRLGIEADRESRIFGQGRKLFHLENWYLSAPLIRNALHLSDLHVEMNENAMRRVADLAHGLEYDLCVLTGDYRAATAGSVDACLDGLQRLRRHLKEPLYGVLGNHDSIRMVP